MDYFEIVKRIIEQDKIPDLLKKAECGNIRLRGNRYEAQLPPKFNSDNERSVQVYFDERGIVCKVRSRPFYGSSIFDLISYLVFDRSSEDEMRSCFPKSIEWICKSLGYLDLIDPFYEFNKPKNDPLSWLDEIHKRRKYSKNDRYENAILDNNVMSHYINAPYQGFIDEGVNIETQQRFQIGLDIYSERAVFPIHNAFGDIISVKGRYIGNKPNVPKYMYLYNFNKSIELYNWHLAVYHILKQREIIVFEGEKSVWRATQWGFKNSVALGGGDISREQAEMIKRLGLDISICLAFDKDVRPDDIKKKAEVFGHTNSVYVLYDSENLFSIEEKHSPTDLGIEKFKSLYDNRTKHKIV